MGWTDEERADEVMTADQVAGLLRVTVDHVRRLSRDGLIPAHRLPGGRSYQYLRSEVLEWLRRL